MSKAMAMAQVQESSNSSGEDAEPHQPDTPEYHPDEVPVAADAGEEAPAAFAEGDETAVAAGEETGVPAPQPPGKDWYNIHTYSGFEQKVADSLKTRAEAFG